MPSPEQEARRPAPVARLTEDRVTVAGRKQHGLVPFRARGLDFEGRASSVDPRSILRLSFDAGSAAGVTPDVPALDQASRRLSDLAEHARIAATAAREALGGADALGGVRRSREELERFASLTLAGDAREELVASVRTARGIVALDGERVIVEAFRIHDRSRTALALAGYNDIGSGRVANLPRRVAELASDVLAAARRTVAAEQSLRDVVDASRRELLAAQGGSTDRQSAVAELASSLARLLDSATPAANENALASAYVDLPHADVDLAGNKIERGERVDVFVSLVKENDPTGARENVASWVADVERIGWYRDESLFAILSRGDSGGLDATNWELSFAGSVTWSWYQDEDRPLGELYSWFQPGFGIHLAALDQVADDVEFGIGMHVSLWEGLVIVGAGWNLTVDENNTYYLIGGDLLGWKDKITGTVR